MSDVSKSNKARRWFRAIEIVSGHGFAGCGKTLAL
jgi:hypothetical protein